MQKEDQIRKDKNKREVAVFRGFIFFGDRQRGERKKKHISTALSSLPFSAVTEGKAPEMKTGWMKKQAEEEKGVNFTIRGGETGKGTSHC